MKGLLFIMASVFTANVVCGQTTIRSLPQQKIDELNQKLKGMKFNLGVPYHIPTDSSAGKISFNKFPPAGIYSLPEDNMVCIVPDRITIENIPNGIKVQIPFHTTIPNAYHAKPLIQGKR
jgi:hypothetical protein